MCEHILNYEARAAMLSVPNPVCVLDLNTPDNGGPEFAFARGGITHFGNVTIQQAMKGYLKYNQELDPLDPKHNWDGMIEEELADAWQYVQANKVRKAEVVRLIEEALSDLTSGVCTGRSVGIENKLQKALELLK